MNDNLIYIAKITKPHGIKGQARILSHAQNPEDIFKYSHLCDEKLNKYKLKNHGQNNNIFIVSFNDNTSRNLVEELTGTKLYIMREMLAEAADDEYYSKDLENLEVFDSNKNLRGFILEIHNFGAGDIFEMKIKDSKDTVFLPFDKKYIMEVNIKNGYLIFDFAGAGIEYKTK